MKGLNLGRRTGKTIKVGPEQKQTLKELSYVADEEKKGAHERNIE